MSERFYCPDPAVAGRFLLGNEEAHHLARVSRHGPGDLVELFDGKGFATCARIVKITSGRVELVAEGEPLSPARPGCELTLATAVPKGDRFDWIVEKATELGAARLIPLLTERSVVDPRQSKLERLRKTVIEASKQCRRSDLMVVESPTRWEDLAKSTASGSETRLIALQSGRPPTEWPRLATGSKVVLAVGPEGGFSPRELEAAQHGGWFPVRLSPHTLRIETASIAGISAILAKTVENLADAVV